MITELDTPFAFARTGKIRRLENIAFAVTIYDGSTAPGDLDENELSLALNGIDTGILLNGFRHEL